MFENIGRKIRTLATVVFFVGALFSFIGMIALWITGGGLSGRLGGFTIFILGLLTGVVGGLLSWACGCLVFGFGRLVEDAEAIRHNTEDTQYCADNLRRMAEEYRRAPAQRARQSEDGE